MPKEEQKEAAHQRGGVVFRAPKEDEPALAIPKKEELEEKDPTAWVRELRSLRQASDNDYSGENATIRASLEATSIVDLGDSSSSDGDGGTDGPTFGGYHRN
jgi:hypothetical protein